MIKDWVQQGTKDTKYYCQSCDKEINHEDFHRDKKCEECRK